MAYCYPTRSFWLRRPRNPTWTRFVWLNSQSVRFSSTRTLCTQRRCQVHLLPRHQASFARSYCRRRTWLGFRKCCVTCLVSSCCSQWPNRLHYFSNYTSIMSTPGEAKKIIQAVRSFISQDIDLVADDFNGEVWCCRSRDNLSSINWVFCWLCHAVVGPGSIIEHPSSQRFWKVNKHVLSLHLDKFSVCAPMIKAAIISRGFICTSLTWVTSGTIIATTGISASQNVVRIL